MKNLTTAQLSAYLGVTKRTIQRRAQRENWPYATHGTKRLYTFANLPAELKQKVISKIIMLHERQGTQYKLNPTKQPHKAGSFVLADNPFITLDNKASGNWLSQHTFAYSLDITELDKEYVKTGLLVLARLYLLSFSMSKIKGFDLFCQQYNQREFAINKSIYTVVNRISRITLLRWEKQLEQQGAKHDLTDEYNIANTMERDIRKIAEELLMVAPDITGKRLKQHFSTLFGDRKTPSERFLGQWLDAQKSTVSTNH